MRLKIKRTDSLSVVPASVVHPLTQQFNWGLGPVSFEHGHVEVVDVEHCVLAQGWGEYSLPTLVKFAVYEVLFKRTQIN